jgi:putative membrane protein
MSVRDFFVSEARARVAEAIRDVEAQTSAELVVCVRRVSADYRHADYLAGAIAAFAALLLLLFLPQPFLVELMPLDVALAFLAGVLASTRLPALRRTLARRRRLDEEVRKAARAAFYEMGVSRTRGRTGVLVFASMLEQCIEVVPDVGVDLKALGPSLVRATDALAASVRGRTDFALFLDGLKALGPALAPSLPRAEDDVNELPDDLVQG